MLYLSIILATLSIQVPNLWAIKRFGDEPALSTAFAVAFFCLPASFLATAMFAYFYGRGYETLSYPTMSVMAYGVSLLTNVFIHFFILRAKTLALSELVGIALILSGLAIIILFRK